jgi:ABC-type lipoprotein release transport system permease subunit
MELGPDLRHAARSLWRSPGFAAAAVARALSSLLLDVRPLDPVTFAAVAALMVVVALLACLAPARRAARLDPIVALRYE